MILERIAASAIILGLIILAPYWIYLPALLLAVVIIPFFWEGIILGLFIDLMYGAPVSSSLLPFSPVAITAGLLVLFLPALKKHLRLNV